MLLLAACHLFVPDPVIDCVKGQPCAGPQPETGETGTEPTTAAPTVGWALALEDDANPRARLYSAEGDMRFEWSDVEGASQVAWDDANGQGMLLDDEGAWYLLDDGSTELISESVEITIHDVAYFKKSALITTEGDGESALYRMKDHAGTTDEIRTRNDGSYTALATTEDTARVVFLASQPDVFEVTSDFDLTIYSAAYDTDTAVSDALAFGEGGQLYVCSSTGAVYLVRDLADGDRTPEVATSEEVDDVVACAWDDALGAWLFGSLGSGILRVDRDGTSEVLFSMPGGYTPMDVFFY